MSESTQNADIIWSSQDKFLAKIHDTILLRAIKSIDSISMNPLQAATSLKNHALALLNNCELTLNSLNEDILRLSELCPPTFSKHSNSNTLSSTLAISVKITEATSEFLQSMNLKNIDSINMRWLQASACLYYSNAAYETFISEQKEM